MLCKDVMFFDENMQPIKKPDFEKCSDFDFEKMYFDTYYIFIDGNKALKEWDKVYSKFITGCHHQGMWEKTGAYIWHSATGGWKHLATEISELSIIKNQLQEAYIRNSRLPLAGQEEL